MEILHSPKYYYSGEFAAFRDLIKRNGMVVTYRKGDMVVNVNEFMDYKYFVLDGVLRFFVRGEDLDGSILEKTIWFIGPDNMFPLCGTCSSHKCRFEYENQFLQAHTDVTAIVISSETCIELMHDNFDFTTAMLGRFADLVGILLYESLNLSRSALKRICNFLIMYTTSLQPAGICLSQEEIASVTGLTLPTVARILKSLRDQHIIETSRKVITITDPDRLHNLCSDAAQDAVLLNDILFDSNSAPSDQA